MPDRGAPPSDRPSLPSLAEAILAAADEARIGITVTFLDGDAPRNVHMSDEAVRIFGWPKDVLLQRSAFDNLAPEEREASRARHAARLAGQPAAQRFETIAVRQDGSRVPVDCAVATVTIDGRPAAVTFVQDITEPRRIEKRLAQSERLAALGTLAAGVAHEVNNPLTYVLLNLEAARRGLAGMAPDAAAPPDVVSRIEEAREGAERVARIVAELRTFARGDREGRGPVDVRTVLGSAIALAQNELRHRARVVTDLGDLPFANASAARLEQVFVNLLVNAAQAIPEGHIDRNEVRITARAERPDRIIVEVSDTGPGIPPEEVGRVFDPFFTTKPVGVGTGLGLSICHGILASIGGEITVRSTPGQGTTFRVSLPRASSPPPPPPVAPPAAPARAAPARRARILLVDDEPALTTTLRCLLEGQHDVVAVNCGRAAIDLILGGGDFDLVLCDLMMPEMTGMDVHEALRRERPGMERRLVFMTGGAFTPRAVAFLDSVPNPRVEKPFDVSAVERLLRELGEARAPRG